MNIKSFKKIVIILSLLIGGSNIILSSDFNQSTFLFCLKSDMQPLSISKSNDKLLVNNSSIQNFIDILIDKKINSIISFKDQYNLMKVCFAADRSIILKKKIKIEY